jgi:osmoprotectant transport system ATP-binding protein
MEHVMLPTVAIHSVTKHLGPTRALDAVSLELPAGETTAILGESGCGKTSLLRHINGLLKPDDGSVEVFGKPINYAQLPELRRRMGYAIQSVGLFPHLTIADNITLVARLSGWTVTHIQERSEHLMESMKLGPILLHRFPHELSGGQRQRVGICRAMMLNPDLLLLDEPFSGVDPIARTRIHENFLSLLRAEPSTTILVTHDVREAIQLASNLVIMEQGRVLQAATVETVLANPATASIARLFREQLSAGQNP